MRITTLRLVSILGASLLLAGCGPFSPDVPYPDSRGEVAIGIRAGAGNSYSLGSLRVEIRSVFASEDELVAVAHAVRDALAPTEGAVVVNWSGVGGDRTSLNATLESAWTPSVHASIDVPGVTNAVEDVGFELQYLHWCGPHGYEVRSTSPQTPLTGPDFRCALWIGETELVATMVTLQSERPSLALSLPIVFVALAAAVWAIGELVMALLRRREVRWLTLGGAVLAWTALNVLYAMFVLPTIPKPRTVVDVEPAAAGLGRLIDAATPLLAWSSIYVGLAAIVLSAGAAIIFALFRGDRHGAKRDPRSGTAPPWSS